MKRSSKKLLLTCLIAAVVLVALYAVKTPGTSDNAQAGNKNKKVVDGDILIAVDEISETVTFYPAEINGIELEALAVKASDGSIRTAFNTCQVCYASGRGYYKQDGDKLICQNCGNRFSMNQVEMTRGGCNPVPITDEYKTVTDDTIIISKEFLEQAAVIFENWK